MTTRHYGIPRVTSRPAPGVEQPPAGSHPSSKYALPGNSILYPSGASLELSEIGKPSPDELEMGARGFLALCLAGLFTLLGIFFAVAHAFFVA